MPNEQVLLLTAGILLIAFLYSCVGHAGASGYIAIMSLFGLAPVVIKPTALLLNILVASIATWQFCSAGHFSWRLFWPFAALAVPFAFLGGFINLPARAFEVVVGIILLLSALRLLFIRPGEPATAEPPIHVAVPVGAGLGFLSGLTGTGGGIFLTPLLLFMRWATAKQAAGASAVFILVNSVSGLAGNLSSTRQLPSLVLPLAVAAVLGGAAGSYLGSRRLPHVAIKRLLGVVLLVAGAKLIFTV